MLYELAIRSGGGAMLLVGAIGVLGLVWPDRVWTRLAAFGWRDALMFGIIGLFFGWVFRSIALGPDIALSFVVLLPLSLAWLCAGVALARALAGLVVRIWRWSR